MVVQAYKPLSRTAVQPRALSAGLHRRAGAGAAHFQYGQMHYTDDLNRGGVRRNARIHPHSKNSRHAVVNVVAQAGNRVGSVRACPNLPQIPSGGIPTDICPKSPRLLARSLTLRSFLRPTNNQASSSETPFKKIMAANRGEIAVRITRAGLELGLQTLAI